MLLATLLHLASNHAWAAPPPNTTAFKNVNVITMDPGRKKQLEKGWTVVVEDGLITAAGKTKKVEIPGNATVVNGRRKMYVLPGLWDMHAHGADVLALPERFGPRDLYTYYLANGITGVFDPWGFSKIQTWGRNLEKGKVVGPELHFTSPGVNNGNHATADAVERSVKKWVKQGYEYIKTHSDITEEKFRRLHQVARKLGVPVVGHALRPGFPIQATLEKEQKMLTHIEEILSTTVSDRRLESFEGDLRQPLADIVESGIWVTGTVDTYEMITKTVDDDEFQKLLSRPEMKYFPPSAHDVWENDNRYRDPSFLQDPAFWAQMLEIKLYIANQLKRSGALDRLLLGTDSGIPLVLPGFAIHDELRLLVRAGLKPWQALRTGTYNPAVFLGREDELGTVAVGKRANLLVVRKNPLKKIKNLKRIEGVMLRGVWLSQDELDARLDELADRWK